MFIKISFSAFYGALIHAKDERPPVYYEMKRIIASGVYKKMRQNEKERTFFLRNKFMNFLGFYAALYFLFSHSHLSFSLFTRSLGSFLYVFVLLYLLYILIINLFAFFKTNRVERLFFCNFNLFSLFFFISFYQSIKTISCHSALMYVWLWR